MMIRSFLLIFILLFTLNTSAQKGVWSLVNSYEIEGIDAWDVNPMSQVILASGGEMIKLDTSFFVLFTQSNSMYSNITKIDASHSLKSLIFSEDDQMVGVMDNTLTFQEGEMYLAKFNVALATHISYSGQSQRLWVYDEDNSRLICFQGVSSNQRVSEISNLSSITGTYSPTDIIERNQELFLFYKGDGVFIFDYYGSLIRKYENTLAKQIFPTEKFLYLLVDDAIIRIDKDSKEEIKIKLPYEGVEDFRVSGNFVFLKDKKGIKKYFLR